MTGSRPALPIAGPLPAMLRLCVVALALAAGTAQAQAENFRLDPVHTRLAFQVGHAGFSRPIGTFSQIEGDLRFDPDDWGSAALDVRVPIATLDLGDAKWRERILDRTFFDASRWPQARFVSTRVEPVDATHARVTGELTLHGVTAPVTLEVSFNALRRHPLTFKRTAGFSAKATLRRSDFGMDAWKKVVGDEVELTIEVEAVRGGDDAPAQ